MTITENELTDKAPLPRLAFTTKEAAASLGISMPSLWRLAKAGKIRVNRSLPRRPIIAADELRRFASRSN